MTSTAWSGRASGSAARALALAGCVVIAGLAGACAIGPRGPVEQSFEPTPDVTADPDDAYPSSASNNDLSTEVVSPSLRATPTELTEVHDRSRISVTYAITDISDPQVERLVRQYIERHLIEGPETYRAESWMTSSTNVQEGLPYRLSLEIRDGPSRFSEGNTSSRSSIRVEKIRQRVRSWETSRASPRSWQAPDPVSGDPSSDEVLFDRILGLPWPPVLDEDELETLQRAGLAESADRSRFGRRSYLITVTLEDERVGGTYEREVIARVDGDTGLITDYLDRRHDAERTVAAIDVNWSADSRPEAFELPDWSGEDFQSMGARDLLEPGLLDWEELTTMVVAGSDALASGHAIQPSVLVTDRITYADGLDAQTWYVMQEALREDGADLVLAQGYLGTLFGRRGSIYYGRPDESSIAHCCEGGGGYECVLVCQREEDRDITLPDGVTGRYLRLEEVPYALVHQSVSWSHEDGVMVLANVGERMDESAFLDVVYEYYGLLGPATDLLPAPTPSPTPLPLTRARVEAFVLDRLRDDLVITRVESRLVSSEDIVAWMGSAGDWSDDWHWIVAVVGENFTAADSGPIPYDAPVGYPSESPPIHGAAWWIGAESGALVGILQLHEDGEPGYTLDDILALPDADESVLEP